LLRRQGEDQSIGGNLEMIEVNISVWKELLDERI
jgi:hypothetical protein